MHVAWDVVAFVEADPAEFACVGEADSSGRPSDPREQAAAGESLAVDDEVVASVSEGSEEVERRAGLASLEPAREFGAWEANNSIKGGVVLDGVGEGVTDEPVDRGVWKSPAEADKDGDGSADVAEGAGADEQDARGLVHDLGG